MTDSLLLSTGEFARMCCVSRELLVHYDKIGLLKPKKVEGNGYRYYSLRQLYLFDVIRFFIDTGMSTKEVRDYLENRSTDLFLDTIQESIDALGRVVDIPDASCAREFYYTKLITWVSEPEKRLRQALGDRLDRKPPHRRMQRLRKEGAAR